MAFPLPKKKVMPPPGSPSESPDKKPGLAIAIDIAKPKKPGEGDPDNEPDPADEAPESPMTGEAEPDEGESAGGATGKITEEKAMTIRADQHCGQCGNYIAESGECKKVDGLWHPDDACYAHNTSIWGKGESEPDEDDQPPAAGAMGGGEGMRPPPGY